MKISYTLAALLLTTTIATAAETTGFLDVERIALKGPYIGANIGFATGQIDEDTVKASLCAGATGCTPIDYNEAETALGAKVYGGYLVNDNFAVEGGYFNLGELSFDAESNKNTTYEGTLAVQGLNIDAVGFLPINKEVSVFARLGLTYAEMDQEATHTAYKSVEDQWEAGYKYGVGLQFDMESRIGVRIEAENYHMSERNSDTGFDMQLYSIGVVYSFGEETKAEPEPVVLIKESKPKIIEKEVVKVVPKEVVKVVPVEKQIIKTERVVLTSDALFDYNKASIKPAGKASLKKLADNLQPDDKLVVTGYTDSIGSAKYNMKLSQRRADAVKWQLFDYGVAANRIKTKAMGEANPVATNKTAEGRALNRRVEIEIKSPTTVK